MATPELRESLRRLCGGGGWSYAVFWRVDRRDPRMLVVEESYYEEDIGATIEKIINQAYMLGDGTIGTAAISGNHQWIYSDTVRKELSSTSPSDNVGMCQGNVEWQHHFLAGLKTIVLISLPSLGVVQFGSTEKICESLEFIDQVKSLFRQLDPLRGQFLQEEVHKAMNFSDVSAAFPSIVSSADTSYESISFLRDVIGREQKANLEISKGHPQSSDPVPLGVHIGTRSHSGSKNSCVSDMPIISSSIDASKSFSNLSQITPSTNSISAFYTRDSAAAQVLLPPNNFRSNSGFHGNSFATYLTTSTWAKEGGILPMLEQKLLSGLATQGNPSKFPVNSHSSVSHTNSVQYICGDLTSSHSPCLLQGIHDKGHEPCCFGEKLLDLRHFSGSSFPVCDLPDAKLFSRVSSFTPDLSNNFLNFAQDPNPEGSVLLQSDDDPRKDEIHPCDQRLEQMNDCLTVPTRDSLVSASGVSSGSAQNEIAGCTSTTNLPGKLVENSGTGDVKSLDTDFAWKESSLNAPVQLFSDNDLFEGMELDIGPRILGQESWDEIIMPVGSGSCSKASTSVSDCLSDRSMGSMAVADKGFFSESCLEQLLDAVVGGNAKLSSTHSPVTTNISSAATSISSVAHLESEHQFSTVINVGSPLIRKQPAPLITLPSLIQTSDMSFPECNLEKIMKGSLKEALPKCHATSWIDDSCSMNGESAVINQPKKPEDAAKVVRKRARPGESTRPRPKDRQQIQDRVKELREIVPNGAKCSIDALLDRTIKHMLFLQSVTKYADKLKQADEPLMIGEESGVVLRDNSSGGGSGSGATWAYEVAGQTMVCPILVEDLNPPGQMLVEMLCEERGLFLEIADIIRGFGLTILKGVMEVRESKIWARFLVEANRDVTRMDIFISLVQLLQQTNRSEQQSKAVDKAAPSFSNYQQPLVPIPVSLADTVQ